MNVSKNSQQHESVQLLTQKYITHAQQLQTLAEDFYANEYGEIDVWNLPTILQDLLKLLQIEIESVNPMKDVSNSQFIEEAVEYIKHFKEKNQKSEVYAPAGLIYMQDVQQKFMQFIQKNSQTYLAVDVSKQVNRLQQQQMHKNGEEIDIDDDEEEEEFEEEWEEEWEEELDENQDNSQKNKPLPGKEKWKFKGNHPIPKVQPILKDKDDLLDMIGGLGDDDESEEDKVEKVKKQKTTGKNGSNIKKKKTNKKKDKNKKADSIMNMFNEEKEKQLNDSLYETHKSLKADKPIIEEDKNQFNDQDANDKDNQLFHYNSTINDKKPITLPKVQPITQQFINMETSKNNEWDLQIRLIKVKAAFNYIDYEIIDNTQYERTINLSSKPQPAFDYIDMYKTKTDSYVQENYIPIVTPIYELLSKSALLRTNWQRTIELPISLAVHDIIKLNSQELETSWEQELTTPNLQNPAFEILEMQKQENSQWTREIEILKCGSVCEYIESEKYIQDSWTQTVKIPKGHPIFNQIEIRDEQNIDWTQTQEIQQIKAAFEFITYEQSEEQEWTQTLSFPIQKAVYNYIEISKAKKESWQQPIKLPIISSVFEQDEREKQINREWENEVVLPKIKAERRKANYFANANEGPVKIPIQLPKLNSEYDIIQNLKRDFEIQILHKLNPSFENLEYEKELQIFDKSSIKVLKQKKTSLMLQQSIVQEFVNPTSDNLTAQEMLLKTIQQYEDKLIIIPESDNKTRQKLQDLILDLKSQLQVLNDQIYNKSEAGSTKKQKQLKIFQEEILKDNNDQINDKFKQEESNIFNIYDEFYDQVQQQKQDKNQCLQQKDLQNGYRLKLNKIFKHYSKQSQNLNNNQTFENIENSCNILTLNKFMHFLHDFKLSFNPQKVSEIYKKVAPDSSTLEQSQFSQLITQLYQHKYETMLENQHRKLKTVQFQLKQLQQPKSNQYNEILENNSNISHQTRALRTKMKDLKSKIQDLQNQQEQQNEMIQQSEHFLSDAIIDDIGLRDNKYLTKIRDINLSPQLLNSKSKNSKLLMINNLQNDNKQKLLPKFPLLKQSNNNDRSLSQPRSVKNQPFIFANDNSQNQEDKQIRLQLREQFRQKRQHNLSALIKVNENQIFSQPNSPKMPILPLNNTSKNLVQHIQKIKLSNKLEIQDNSINLLLKEWDVIPAQNRDKYPKLQPLLDQSSYGKELKRFEVIDESINKLRSKRNLGRGIIKTNPVSLNNSPINSTSKQQPINFN